MHSLSLTGKRWRFADGADERPADPLTLPGKLAALRDIDARTVPYDPSVFPDTPAAVERIERAAKAGERVAVFGDYDCDGVTGAALLLRALQRKRIAGIAMLPHRARDGYGLKPWAIERCAAQGATLLITVDNGVQAHEAIALARSRGIDVLVIDHHSLPAPGPDGKRVLPDANAILHPSLSPAFPGAHPAAAGAAFLFLHALEGGDWRGRPTDLALAAMGTVADLVPLTGYNRTLVTDGLQAINSGKLEAPLQALIASVNPNGAPLASGDIAFRIAPRINAAGRMADPFLALRALLEGGEPLRELDRLNALRQEETQRCLDHALADITESPFPCLADGTYAPGIVGLIAGKLTEQLGRPSLVASVQGELCVASLRSTAEYHVTEGLARCADLLETYGGHAQAAGCTFRLDRYPQLRERLEADVRERVSMDALIPGLTLDGALSSDAVSLALCTGLSRLEPFGQGNPQPLFLLRNVRLSGTRRVGADGKHLQCQADGIKAIGFGLGKFQEDAEQPLDLACSIAVDTWNGNRAPQLMIKDMRASATLGMTR